MKLKMIIILSFNLFLIFNQINSNKIERIAKNPLLDYHKKESIFQYNYNPTYLPIYVENVHIEDALIVRSHNIDMDGKFVISYAKDNLFKNNKYFGLTNVNQNSIIFQKNGKFEDYAVEDPRIAYNKNDQTYYMFYSAVQNEEKIISRLALATSKHPWIANEWQRHGVINDNWSKSGAVIFADENDEYNYLYWGDKDITCWKTKDLKSKEKYEDCGDLLKTRSDNLDSELVESGPAPIKLSNGDYLFIYNSARKGVPSWLKDWDLEYNIFYAIIDGNDKTKLKYRSNTPIIKPELSFEKDSRLLLKPNVVFAEGAKKMDNSDDIIIFYGCGDTYVGAAYFEFNDSKLLLK